MQPQKIYDLKQAAQRAYQNYLNTRSDVARRVWQRMLQELKKAKEQVSK